MAGGRIWTAEEDGVLLEMVKRGIKHSVVAKRMGRGKTAVTSRLGVLRKREGSPLPRLHRAGELRTWVERLTIPGVSDSTVAGILGVSRSTVLKTRLRFGIKAGCVRYGRPPSPETQERGRFANSLISIRAKVLTLYSGVGMSDVQIAEILQYSKRQVGNIRRSFGLPPLGDRNFTPNRDRGVKTEEHVYERRVYTIRRCR